MRSLALINPGPLWTDGRPIFEQDRVIVRGHLDAMRRLFDAGGLLLGGPMAGGRSGLAVLESADLHAAHEALAGDPAVSSGLFRYELTELTPYFDAFDGTRHEVRG